ncbi:unnamed protein product, partial [Staurois parvus]
MSEYRAGRSAVLSCRTLAVPRPSAAQSSRPTHDRSQKTPDQSQSAALLSHAHWAPGCQPCAHTKRWTTLRKWVRSPWSSPVLSAVSGHPLYCPQSLVIPCTVRSLWSSPVLCLQFLVIPCTVSAVSGHLLYYVRSLWSSPVLCLQSLVISCTMSAVSGHLLYCVRSLWSSPVLCPQSLVISCTMSAVSGHLLYYVRSLWSSPVLCPQ